MKDQIRYTTEATVTKFCVDNIDRGGIINKQFRPYKFRPDFVSHNKKLVVEFDGYQHYTNPETILRDYRKDSVLTALHYTIIRIPYFVQLDKTVMKMLFGKYIDVEPYDCVDFPHGFIDAKAVLPAHFCSLGIQRFTADMIRFQYIEHHIEESLRKRIAEIGDRRLVLPTPLGK